MGKYVKTFEGFYDEKYNYDHICEVLSLELNEDPKKIYHFCSLFEESMYFEEDMSEDNYIIALRKFIEDVNNGIEPDPRDDDDYYDTTVIIESKKLNEDRYTDLSERDRDFKKEFKSLFKKLKSRDFDEEHCLELVKEILK
jgi:hypothetical protein